MFLEVESKNMNQIVYVYQTYSFGQLETLLHKNAKMCMVIYGEIGRKENPKFPNRGEEQMEQVGR